MAAIDDILEQAQNTYFTINGTENDDTGEDLTLFENNFIRSFNMWLKEFEVEAYWNQVRVDDYVLATVADTDTYSFELPDDYRTPVFSPNKYLKFITDGTVIARFKMVNPNQRQVDDDFTNPNRATFVGRNVVLSRAPKSEEIGAEIVLDVVSYFPKLARNDSDAISLIDNDTLIALGNAKNNTLSDVTKVNLSPGFAQKYAEELRKAKAINNASNSIDEMQRDDYGYIGSV